MAYKVIILYRLYMPSYVLGTFTEYPWFLQYGTFVSWACNPSFIKVQLQLHHRKTRVASL